MRISRLGRCLLLTSCLGSIARPTGANPSLAQAGDAERPAQQASIVLVGAAGHDHELGALLTELLERRGVGVRISERPDFGPAELLRAGGPSGVVDVFVVPGSGGNLGLYFRAPDGERFLLRSVLLRGGFDDVGREQVGQIVETAVVSLLQAGTGLTREQAQRVLTDTSPTAIAPRAAPSPDARGTTSQPTARQPRLAPKPTQRSRPSSALDGWFALRYGATLLGGGLGVAHGPALELGLGVERGWLLRGRVTFERDFAQTFEAPLITAELSSLRWRLAVDAGLPIAPRQLLLLSLGAGQDRSQVTPTAVAKSSFTPAPAFQSNAPLAHAELRYEVVLTSLRLAAAVGADASLLSTHYDVARSTAAEPGLQRVSTPWRLHPTAGLALAFCPRWATF